MPYCDAGLQPVPCATLSPPPPVGATRGMLCAAGISTGTWRQLGAALLSQLAHSLAATPSHCWQGAWEARGRACVHDQRTRDFMRVCVYKEVVHERGV